MKRRTFLKGASAAVALTASSAFCAVAADLCCRVKPGQRAMTLSPLMQLMVAEGAEAAHVDPGEAPVLRIKRILHRVDGPPLKPADTEALFESVASDDLLHEFRRAGIVRFAHRLADAAIFRVTAFRQDGHVHLQIGKCDKD